MTLILSRASRRYILQVADRLLTKEGKEHDPRSNKTIILKASNGIASIGYCGLAYIKDKPMDQWLVEKLVGQTFERRFGMRQCWLPRIDMGTYLTRLAQALQTIKTPPEITQTALFIVGWQWKRTGYFRPIVARIHNTSSGFTLEYIHRYWYVGSKEIVKFTQGGVRISKQLCHEIANRSSMVKSLDEAEMLLIEAVRSVSKASDLVGGDCMCVRLLPPPYGLVRIRYVPAVSESDSESELEAYSPWIVCNNLIAAPSVLTGEGWGFQLGFFEIKIDAISNKRSLPSYLKSQNRVGP